MVDKYSVQKASADGERANHSSFFCSFRFMFAIIGFCVCLVMYAQRVGMSVAIVCMVNHTAVLELGLAQAQPSNQNNASFGDIDLLSLNFTGGAVKKAGCYAEDDNDYNSTNNGSQSKLKDGEFVWEKSIQGHVLGAFFYGYTISQIPGGLLAERFGAKWVLFSFLGLSSLATLLTPLAARFNVFLLIGLRVIVGVGSGVLFPAMHAMLGQWSPPFERSMTAGVVYAGGMMGNVIALPVSGVLCEHGFDDGWGSIFYIIGGASLVSLTVWAVFTSSTPATNKFMSKSEKQYIAECLQGEVSDRKTPFNEIPWLSFFTSGPVWSLIIANFCIDWGFYTLLTNIPTFYREVLYFDMTSNGLYSALPFIGLWVTINVSSLITDRLLSAKVFSITTARKILTSIGLFLPAAFLISLSFLDCTQTGLAVALLTLSVSFLGCTFSGYLVNHMDIAPKYAGTLMGITNGIGATSGFIAPIVAASLTTDQSRESWQIVFVISAGMFTFGGVMYNIFGAGVVQPWAKDNYTTTHTIELQGLRG